MTRFLRDVALIVIFYCVNMRARDMLCHFMDQVMHSILVVAISI